MCDPKHPKECHLTCECKNCPYDRCNCLECRGTNPVTWCAHKEGATQGQAAPKDESVKTLVRKGGENVPEPKKAAQDEAAKPEFKCPKCGNVRIKKRHNYCVVCGNQLKENPVIIDFYQKQQV